MESAEALEQWAENKEQENKELREFIVNIHEMKGAPPVGQTDWLFEQLEKKYLELNKH